MSRVSEKMTYTDGQYFCNRCDSPHEGESLAEACFDECKKAENAKLSCVLCNDLVSHFEEVDGQIYCLPCCEDNTITMEEG